MLITQIILLVFVVCAMVFATARKLDDIDAEIREEEVESQVIEEW